MAKSFIQSYGATYIIESGKKVYREEREEVERRAPLLIMIFFGLSAGVLPLLMSAIFNTYGFRTTLDVLGIMLSLNAVGFIVHLARSNWRSKNEREMVN